MSTTRSLTTGRLPIGATVTTCPASTYGRIGTLQARTGAAVQTHAARAADRHPARLAIGQGAVVLVLDGVQAVEQRGRRRHLDGVALVAPPGALVAVEALDPQAHLHQLDVVGALEGGEVLVVDRRHAGQ
jgi:hypothetical protein